MSNEARPMMRPSVSEPAEVQGVRTLPAVPSKPSKTDIDTEVRPSRGLFKSGLLAVILSEEIIEVDRIRLAELAAKGPLAGMD